MSLYFILVTAHILLQMPSSSPESTFGKMGMTSFLLQGRKAAVQSLSLWGKVDRSIEISYFLTQTYRNDQVSPQSLEMSSYSSILPIKNKTKQNKKNHQTPKKGKTPKTQNKTNKKPENKQTNKKNPAKPPQTKIPTNP
ncbi:hypothetical protein llap_11948 [Limosa lapponica baueri]|uniref:Uncharacterized protein n=1 Tax=Limosa lapponica baueri TaxID=1758121 RepID=A0A2I0TVA7_LIMLA|nr:hypothetical protein llap_11948 [Limosa lapponica baueri]